MSLNKNRRDGGIRPMHPKVKAAVWVLVLCLILELLLGCALLFQPVGG